MPFQLRKSDVTFESKVSIHHHSDGHTYASVRLSHLYGVGVEQDHVKAVGVKRQISEADCVQDDCLRATGVEQEAVGVAGAVLALEGDLGGHVSTIDVRVSNVDVPPQGNCRQQ